MDENIRNLIPVAEKDSDKKKNGVLLAVSGSSMIVGAPVFNIKGAATVGTGYIRAVITPDILPVVGRLCPYAVFSEKLPDANDVRAVLIGSGCDRRPDFDGILDAVLLKDVPVILDAYALRRVAERNIGFKSRKSATVLTPHYGEFAKLTGKTVAEIEKDPEEAAKAFAIEKNAIVVLKSRKTVITDGSAVAVNRTGCANLAKAGSGDVLSGLIAGLCARGVKAFDACIAGTYLLGTASERLAEKQAIAVTQPSDICDEVGRILFEWGK